MLINDNKMERNSSIELLRIISMLMIVFCHFAYNGGFQWENSTITITRLWYNFIIMGGKVGVDIFILISGFFLINQKKEIFQFKKILKFWGQLFFYSVILSLIYCIINKNQFSIKLIIKSFFPITFSTWWFASCYFVLYLFHPFLNKLLHNLDKKTYQYLLILAVVCWSIIPTLTTSQFQSNSLLWFITLYSIAGYIRIYGFNSKLKSQKYFKIFLIVTFITYMSSVIFMILGKRWHIFESNVNYFYGQEKITILIISIMLFMTFVTLNINYNKWINIIASASFGVYLIHDNDLIRPFIWENIFENAKYQNSILLIPYSVIVVIIVYIVCTVIDLARQRFIEKTYLIVINTNIKRWSVYLFDLLNKIRIFIFN